jgi:zinc transporter ZupT
MKQFLEGVALGVATVDAEMKRAKGWLLAAFYSITTPAGIAIGEGRLQGCMLTT